LRGRLSDARVQVYRHVGWLGRLGGAFAHLVALV
jgi:hypothetical protein